MRASPHPRRGLRRAVALLAALLLAAGCADRGGGSSASSGGAMHLKVGQISDSVAFFPLYVAQQKGYFADEGLKIGKPPRLGTGAKLAAALASGSIDLAAGVTTDAFNLDRQQGSTRLVAPLVDSYYVDVIVGKDFHGPPASADLMTKIKALKGKKIGITGPGSGTEALLTYLFTQAGMDASKDATLVNLGADPAAVVGALKTHRVDALSFFQPLAQIVGSQHLGSTYISPAAGDVPQLKGAVHGVVFTTGTVMKAKKKGVRAFTRAIGRAERTINGDPAAVGKLLSGYEKDMDPATVKALVPILQQEIPSRPEIGQQGYTAEAQFHKTAGLLSSIPGYQQIVPGYVRASGGR